MGEASREVPLSVVVPVVTGTQSIMDCLAALVAASSPGLPIEVLAVNRCGDGVAREIGVRFPSVTVVRVASDTSIPRMRAIAFRRARGSAVAVIEDHVIVPRDWPQRLIDALERGADAVGGTLENGAVSTTADWAAFFCEYSRLLRPRAAGPATALTGNNVAYRSARLAAYAATIDAERWEDALHTAMSRDGLCLVYDPSIVAIHARHYRPAEYVGDRYHYSRAYAGLRAADRGALVRLGRAASTVALPPVLLYRIVAHVVASRRHLAELVSALPWLTLFVCVWAAGEAVGWLAGPGDALTKVT